MNCKFDVFFMFFAKSCNKNHKTHLTGMYFLLFFLKEAIIGEKW